ncbi:hypothetical protein BXZ70DRAFT_52895 [Cristinia sonorae]|uniref:Uncharacterized protein n=1 Tax=Cristinia sonorae TaxID=1940300 RepID=A0A8K0US28_9AGAR|nr:hypothetical protein BXZ70DRAFT_52895 [Cristinia sonorae]
MTTLIEVSNGIAKTTAAFKALVKNATDVSLGLSSMGGSNSLHTSLTVEQWGVAQDGWKVPLNAAAADFKSLANLSSDFVAAMHTVLNATSESVRLDPLWKLIGNITTTPITSTAAFATFLSTVQSYADTYGAAAKAANITDDDELQLLTAYPILTTAASDSLDWVKKLQVTMGEDVAELMLWAGRDASTTSSSQGRECSTKLPRILQEYKKAGGSDYTIMATMLNQL